MKNILLFFFTTIFSLSLFSQQITLEDIHKKRTFRSDYVWGLKSMNDGKYYTSLQSNNKGENYLLKSKYETGDSIEVILVNTHKKIANSGIDSYSFSDDESRILIATNTQSIYRYSTKSDFFIYDRVLDSVFTVHDSLVRLAQLSPDGKMVAFVYNNNLYVKDLSSNITNQITFDGKYNHIINGASDWVYEEEFGFDKAYQWSKDGNFIAFYKFNESAVKQFSMDFFNANLYPKQEKFKYPKAGEKNAKVSIHIYNLSSQKIVDANLGDLEDMYIPRIKWSQNDSILCVFTLNRHQNNLKLILTNANSGKSTLLLNEVNERYIDIHDNLTFLKGGNHFIWTSENDYNHIYLYKMDGTLQNQITFGNWEVTDFYGVDEERGKLFYASTEESSINRMIYSISLDGRNKELLTQKQGVNKAHFSSDYSFFINYYSNANSPVYISTHTSDGSQVNELISNNLLRKKINDYNFVEKEFFVFNTSEGVELNASIMKPFNFKKKKKYPVFIHIYGGPGAQEVQNSWGWGTHVWHQMLTQLGYIVVSVDGRGTGFKGEDFKKMTYLQLGKYETIDLIEAVKYLREIPYVDESRIGIMGWSYGGYLSSLCLTKGADYFSMGIAVAPVTNWRYYDSIYTERYMQTPQENPDGYDDNSPINHVDKLKGKYLLVHGSADDNVHYQNTMEMIEALVQKNKQFDLFIYPDKNHGIYGGNTRYHLFTKITDFIINNL